MNLELERLSETRIRTGASVAVSSLLRRAAQEGWSGLEFLTGVPGSVGGVVAMNAGTHLGEAKDRLRRVESFGLGESPPQMLVTEGPALRFEYRRNLSLPAGAAVWAAEWEITPSEPKLVKDLIDTTLARRKATQPIDSPSCGSVFKNPSKELSAWQVVDRLGLRGHRIGKARFSEKHSNFILNEGGASAADVRGLIELAKRRARDEMGVALEEEVKYVGEWA
jgi:UDP-N-acetylmuramate dehydrogenase